MNLLPWVLALNHLFSFRYMRSDVFCHSTDELFEVHEDEFRRMLEPGRKKMDKLIGRFGIGQIEG